MKKIFGVLLFLYITLMLFLQGQYLYYNGTPLHFWMSIFLELVSIIIIFGIKDAVHKLAKTRHIHKNGIISNAVIKDYYIQKSRMNTYYPIIEFRDRNKFIHKFQSSVGMTFVLPKYRKGKKVKVAYLSKQPESFVIIPSYYYDEVLGLIIFSFLAISSLIGSLSLIAEF